MPKMEMYKYLKYSYPEGYNVLYRVNIRIQLVQNKGNIKGSYNMQKWQGRIRGGVGLYFQILRYKRFWEKKKLVIVFFVDIFSFKGT